MSERGGVRPDPGAVILEDDGHSSKITATCRGEEVTLMVTGGGDRDARIARLIHLISWNHPVDVETATADEARHIPTTPDPAG